LTSALQLSVPGLVAAQPTPITCGVPVSGALLQPGEHDLFEFHAGAGDVVWVSIVETAQIDLGFSPQLTLFRPDGTVQRLATLSGANTVTLGQSGRYTLRVDDIGGDRGSYQLRLEWLVPTAKQCTSQAIACGAPVTSALSENDQRVYAFDATAGDVVWVSIVETAQIDLGFSPQLTLFRPDGTVQRLATLSGANTVTLGQSGRYTLRVDDIGGDRGSYQLRLEWLAPTAKQCTSQPLGCPTAQVAGDLDTNDHDLWVFDGATGSSVRVSLLETGQIDLGFSPQATVYRPDGTIQASVGTSGPLTLTLNQTGRYTVQVYDVGGDRGSYSLAIERPCPLLAPPTGLTATAVSPTQINLAWVENATNETSVRVERSENGTVWTEIAVLTANSTRYGSTGLSCNRAYHYRVRVHRAGDNQFSSYSSPAGATTLVCGGPAAPSGLTATAVSASQIDLAWVDNATDETSVRVERSLDGLVWAEVAVLAANATTYASAGLVCNTYYQHRVRTHRATDNQFSTYSTPAAATTMMCSAGPCATASALSWPVDNAQTWTFSGNPFGNFQQSWGGHHPGEDWNLSPDDTGRPVRAVAPGLVRSIYYMGAARAYAIAIEHNGSFVIPARRETVRSAGTSNHTYSYPSETLGRIYSVYLHITDPGQQGLIENVSCVNAGQVLGEVANLSDGRNHLHFEIRHPNALNSPTYTLVLPASNWSYAQTGSNPNGYYLSVQEMVNSGQRHPSHIISANLSSSAAPGRPVVSVSTNGNIVRANWEPGPGGAPSSYFVMVGTTSGASEVFAQDVGVATSGEGTLPSGTYFIRVTARNVAGAATSDEVEVRVGATVPGAPTNLRSIVVGSTVSLEWSIPAGGGVPLTYVIEAGSFSGGSNLATFATGSTVPTFIATNVPAGTYFVRTRARNAAGISGASNEVQVTVVEPNAPGAPRDLAPSVTGSTVTLTWGAPLSGGPVQVYRILAGSISGGSNLASVDVPAAQQTFTAERVPPGRYFVRVVALNSAAVGPPSNEVIVNVLGPSRPVRVLYVIPYDRAFRSDHAVAVQNAMVDLQGWYRDQLGGQTFTLFSLQPEICRLPRAAEYYASDSWSKVFMDVQTCAPVSHSLTFAWVLYVDIVHACNAPGRLGAGTTGVTMMPRQDLDGLVGERYFDDCGMEYRYPPSRYVGGAGHELGHAFGLPHPPGCDAGLSSCDQKALMWLGYITYPNSHLRPEEKELLRASPFFR
jgi:hypothetical protein